MITRKVWALGALWLLLGSIPVELHAAEPAEIGFELYSWKKGTEWYFSVLEGTTTVRQLSQIQDRDHQLRGVVFLKGRLASLPSGEKVYWREKPKRGLKLPPKEMIYDINRFADASQLQLILPNETP